MSLKIYYFSGTGNSFFAASRLAKILGGQTQNISQIINNQSNKIVDNDTDILGIVFPVYAWSYPKILNKFLKKIKFEIKPKYIFVLTTFGSTPGNASRKFVKHLKKAGYTVNYTNDIQMPENYIAVFKPLSKKEIEEKQSFAKEKLDIIATHISNGENGNFCTRRMFDCLKTGIVGRVFNLFLRISYRFFKVDNNCGNCGICQKICQMNNIEIIDGKPKWGKSCSQCMACLNWCPKQSIQFTRKTIGRSRYTNPDVMLTDLIDIQK